MSVRCRIGDHKEVWSLILPGLQALYASAEQQDWDIEGVRDLLDREGALLVVDEDDPEAFAVIRVDTHNYNPKELELFVMLAWHEGNNPFERFHPYIELFARSAGAKYLRFCSRRPGMVKAAAKVGYRARAVEYVKEI